MIYGPSPFQEETALFTNPEQLLQLRQELLLLLVRNKNCHNQSFHQLQNLQNMNLQMKQRLPARKLIGHLQESQQLIHNLKVQIETLGEMTVKMIDYIAQVQQKRAQSIKRYEKEIQALKEQLQAANHKNSIIQTDFQILRQRLQNIQYQMDNIARQELQNHQNQKKVIEKERKIELLQLELEKIRKLLASNIACKKEEDLNSIYHSFKFIKSEKSIKLSKNYSELFSNKFHKEQMTDLQQKIRMLQSQNEHFRNEIKTLKNTFSKNVVSCEIRCQDVSNKQNQPLCSSSRSICKLNSSQFQRCPRREDEKESQFLASYCSIENFHPLSSQLNQNCYQSQQYHLNSHLDHLIYLCNQEQDRDKYPYSQMKQLNNSSSVDGNRSMKEKVQARLLCQIGTNTQLDTIEKDSAESKDKCNQTKAYSALNAEQDKPVKPPQKTFLSTLGQWNLGITYVIQPLSIVKRRVVEERINKALHPRKLTRNIHSC